MAQAQITITFTATADANAEGYTTAHGPYTFSATFGHFANNSDSAFEPDSNNNWVENQLSHGQLFTSVTGSGLTGTITRASDPYSRIDVNGTDALGLRVSGDAGDMGLRSLNGTSVYLVMSAVLPVNFTTGASYVDPVTYFSAYLGSYTPTSGSIAMLQGFGGQDDLLAFTVTNVTIAAASAIPEPSTYALLAGAGALGLVVLRRRRRPLGTRIA